MSDTFIVEVVTPTSIKTFEDVRHIRAPGLDGSFGVLSRHIPAIIALRPGEVIIDVGNKRQSLAVSDGYCEIESEKILLLTETAERPEDIDVERANTALGRAIDRLKERPKELDVNRAMAAVQRAKNRLKIAEKS